MSKPAPVRRLPRRAAIALSAGVLVLAVTLGAARGAMPIDATAVLAIVLERLGLSSPWDFTPAQAAILLQVRLPRVLLGALVGGGLSLCGAAVQALLRNPLADPTLLGISAGAALSAALVVVVGPLAGWSLAAGSPGAALAAFVGSVGVTAFIYAIGRRAGRTHVTTMLLAGVGVNALAGAATAALSYVARDAELRSLWFWSLGSLDGASWSAVASVGSLVLLAAVGLAVLARPLNALLLGEAEAGHLGFRVEGVKRALIALTALATAGCVASCGVVGFVGLVVPHLARLLVGGDHRALLPVAGLLGASLLVLADLAARTLVTPAELPLGVVTAAVGAPFFLALLARRAGETR